MKRLAFLMLFWVLDSMSASSSSPSEKCAELLSKIRPSEIKTTIDRFPLELRRGFLSASGTVPQQERLYLRMEDNEQNTGYGEEAPHPRTGPSLDSLEKKIRAAKDCAATPSLQLCALNLQSGKVAIPLWRLLNLPEPRSDIRTVVTYGTENLERTLSEIRTETPAGIKLKLNGNEGELEVVRAIANEFSQPIVLDINANWKPDEVELRLKELEPLANQILWIEQPLPPELMKPLPGPFRFFADEAVAQGKVSRDWYDGVVLKPALYGTKKTLEFAEEFRKQGLAVTFGCLLQSCITTGISLQLSGLVDGAWVDLDSPHHLRYDPFQLDALGNPSRK